MFYCLWKVQNNVSKITLLILLAHLAKGQLSLWDGAASIVRPSTFSFKWLLLQNH